jgi:hypothetical protein
MSWCHLTARTEQELCLALNKAEAESAQIFLRGTRFVAFFQPKPVKKETLKSKNSKEGDS